MSSEPKESKSERLPFEPNRKKAAKPNESPVQQAPEKPVKAGKETQKETRGKRSGQASAAIPDVVSKRMARRMAFFCGIPTSFGMLTFVLSYIIVTQGWYKLPNVAVVLVSLGFFGLGVLGLSYGLLSASWDEERVGGIVGWEEFKANFTRTTTAWKEARQQKRQNTEG